MPALIVALLMLGGCLNSRTVPDAVALEANMLAACEGFATALRVANTLEPSMSESEKVAIDRLVIIADPACHASPTQEALVAVRDALRELTALNQGIHR